jgi:hypothetical protein
VRVCAEVQFNDQIPPFDEPGSAQVFVHGQTNTMGILGKFDGYLQGSLTALRRLLGGLLLPTNGRSLVNSNATCWRYPFFPVRFSSLIPVVCAFASQGLTT